MSLRLLRPARPGGSLVARGTLVHAGRTLALSGVQITDERGRLLVDGSSLCFVRPLPDRAPAPAAARAGGGRAQRRSHPTRGSVPRSARFWHRTCGSA